MGCIERELSAGPSCWSRRPCLPRGFGSPLAKWSVPHRRTLNRSVRQTPAQSPLNIAANHICGRLRATRSTCDLNFMVPRVGKALAALGWVVSVVGLPANLSSCRQSCRYGLVAPECARVMAVLTAGELPARGTAMRVRVEEQLTFGLVLHWKIAWSSPEAVAVPEV